MNNVRAFLLSCTAALLLLAGFTARSWAHPPDPMRKGVVMDLAAAGGSTAPILSSWVSPSGVTAGTRTSALRITVGLTGGASVVNLLVRRNASSTDVVTLALNSGTALADDCLYTFVTSAPQAVLSDSGAIAPLSYNFSATTSTRIGFLSIEECASDDL